MTKVAIVVAQDVQYEEFKYPYDRFKAEGYDIDVILAPKSKYPNPKAKNGTELFWDKTAQEAVASGDFLYDLVFIPGGFCPEVLRIDPEILAIVRYNIDKSSLVAAICHGPQVLLSCRNIPKYTMMSAYPGIKHDVENAGYIYSEDSVVIDRNIITSPHYMYNEDFANFIIEELKVHDLYDDFNSEFVHNANAQ